MSRFRSADTAKLQTWMKSPGALVTDADLASDEAITSVLRGALPGIGVLSEESSTAGADGATSWLVDPLCGTVPFSTGMVHWGVNIALRVSGRLEVAALSLPALKEQLSAVRGKGVSRNGLRWSPPPMEGRLEDLAVGLEIDGGDTWRRLMAHGLEWVPRAGQVNTFASAAYPMAQLSQGRLAAGVFYGIEPVHLAAGAMIATELGLAVTDGAGAPLDWSQDEEFPVVVAGWPDVHRQLIAAMNADG